MLELSDFMPTITTTTTLGYACRSFGGATVKPVIAFWIQLIELDVDTTPLIILGKSLSPTTSYRQI